MPDAKDFSYSQRSFWIEHFQLTPYQASLACALVNTPIGMLPQEIRGQVHYAMLYSLLDVMNGVPSIIADYVRIQLPEGAA